jgi:hypothetical protein
VGGGIEGREEASVLMFRKATMETAVNLAGYQRCGREQEKGVKDYMSLRS